MGTEAWLCMPWTVRVLWAGLLDGGGGLGPVVAEVVGAHRLGGRHGDELRREGGFHPLYTSQEPKAGEIDARELCPLATLVARRMRCEVDPASPSPQKCSRLQPLSGEAQVAQVHSCAAPVPAGSQLGHPRRPTCNRSSDGAPGSRVQHVQAPEILRVHGCYSRLLRARWLGHAR